MDSRHNTIFISSGYLAFIYRFLQPVLDRGYALFQQFIFTLCNGNIITRLCAYLNNAGSHNTTAHHPYLFNIHIYLPV